MEIRRLKVFPGAGKAGVLAPMHTPWVLRFHRDPCSDRHRPQLVVLISGHPEVTQPQSPSVPGPTHLAQVGHGCTGLCPH